MEVLNNNFKHFNKYGCTKNCLPWYLITNYDHNDTIQSQSDEEMECTLNVINDEYFYQSICSKPCSIVQYLEELIFGTIKIQMIQVLQFP